MIDARKWGTGTKFTVPNLDNPDETYLTRYRLLQTPWFAVYLHRLDGPDSRPTLHDHPWSFWGFVLKGGYEERRLDPKTMRIRVRDVHRFNRMKTCDAHAILRLYRKPTWTLLFVGPRVRTWGYWEPILEPEGWDYAADPRPPSWEWTEFNKHKHQEELDFALSWRTHADRH